MSAQTSVDRETGAGTDADLVARLSQAHHLPEAALRQALRHPETVAGPVLAVLERAADDPDALDEGEASLAFWGLHVLAGVRDPRPFPLLLRILRHDEEALDGLLGDAVTETLPLVLAGSFAGDVQGDVAGDLAGLGRLILDSTADPFVCDAGLKALAFLTRQGRIPRETAEGLLVRFDEARVAVEESPAWAAWEEAIAYLGLTGLAPRVAAARADGRLTEEISDAAWFRRALRQAAAEPPDLGAFQGSRYGYLDDPVAALGWTSESAGQPVRNPYKDVGRNDPCPCGSGRKFKKCCLGAQDAAESEAGPVRLPGLS